MFFKNVPCVATRQHQTFAGYRSSRLLLNSIDYIIFELADEKPFFCLLFWGIFKKGDNSNVDRLALKVKSAELKPVKGYPHIGIFGKVLKKGPAEWTDVSNQVVSDYQRLKEDEFVAELRKRYTVEIDKEALKTVNNH